jgi:hypothetical protein
MSSHGRETVLASSGEHAAAGGRLGREDAIDRYLLRSWLDEAG